jgi:hypothetical protein
MLSKTTITSILALCSYTSASSPDLEKRAFSVPQSIPHTRYRDGPEALRKAYLKHGIAVPDALRKRQVVSPAPAPPAPVPKGATTTSIVATSQQNDLEYLSPVRIGNTMMQLDFDTGSSDL